MSHAEYLKISVPAGDTSLELEARWDVPPSPNRVAVLCHPHPKQRGTMNAPLMVGITDGLVDHGFAVLRFNFRGVGESEGVHDYGDAERDDVGAAVATAVAVYPDLPIGVTGWSFGAATSLRWQARDQSTIPWVGIAPPINSVRSKPFPPAVDLQEAARSIVIGDRDQFATVEAAAEYAEEIDATLHVIKGSDHFFYFREDRVAALVAEGLSAAV